VFLKRSVIRLASFVTMFGEDRCRYPFLHVQPANLTGTAYFSENAAVSGSNLQVILPQRSQRGAATRPNSKPRAIGHKKHKMRKNQKSGFVLLVQARTLRTLRTLRSLRLK